MQIFFFFFLLLPVFLLATYFANPALPDLQIDGLFRSPSSGVCLRAGYMADNLYQQCFQDEFTIGEANPSSYAKMETSAATITLDIKNCFDVTALIGSASLQMDHDIFTKRQFAWGIGSKWLVYQNHCLYIAIDLKYFESAQKPLYFIGDGYAFNIVSDFKLNYTEMQAALGAAYRTKVLAPYVYLTYLYSKIEPVPYSLIVRLPFSDATADTCSRSITGARRWGMAVGGTLIGGSKGSVTLESRFFNQNAINISGEIRF